VKLTDYLTTLFGLKDRVAALTGAGGHLVSAMARSLARAGVKVCLLDRSADLVAALADEIIAGGGEAMVHELDVRDRHQIDASIAAILDRFGDVHFLLNGAGINAPTPFLEISLDEWNDILAVQLTGTMLTCQAFGGHMVRRKYGSIVNISSASSGPPLSKAFTYSVAKAGVKNLTQNLGREWAPVNVRVNALRPGFFPTEWSMKHFITPDRERAILGHTPMGRYGKPEELVGAVLWLFSDAASFVTGAEIAVDGGFTAMTI
jgi:NAD(P)-dependent dehydrogenase (short-subunit alcohol dehydrogenase family)